MPDVSILLPAYRTENEHVLTMKLDNVAASVSLYSVPPVLSGSFATWRIASNDRPGMEPVTMAAGAGRRTLTFEHRVWAMNPYDSVADLLAPIREAAEKGKRVTFEGAGFLADSTWWWILKLDVIEDEKARDGHPSRATLTFTCEQAPLMEKTTLTKSEVKTETEAAPTTPAGNTSDPSKPHMPNPSGPPLPPDFTGDGTGPTPPDPTRPGDNRTEE